MAGKGARYGEDVTDGVHHIRHTHVEKQQTAWCGHDVSPMDWTFVSIDHALYALEQGTRATACGGCLTAVAVACKAVVT